MPAQATFMIGYGEDRAVMTLGWRYAVQPWRLEAQAATTTPKDCWNCAECASRAVRCVQMAQRMALMIVPDHYGN